MGMKKPSCDLQSPAKDQEGLLAVPAPLSLRPLGPPLHVISLLQRQGRSLPGAPLPEPL